MSQDTAPFWQVPPLYGAHPQLDGPRRPGLAAAAAVLGITGGSLGLFPAIIVLLAAVRMRETEGAAGSADIMFIILFTLDLVATVTVITLLVTGITFLRGKDYAVLLSVVIAQLVLAALYMAIMLLALNSVIQSMRDRSPETGALVFIIFYILIDLEITVSNLILLCKPTARQWAKRVSRGRPRDLQQSTGMDDPEGLHNCGNGFTHKRCIDTTSGSPDPKQPDTSSTEYPPYPQADPPRQYEYPVSPSGPHNQYSSIFQRPTPPEQIPFSLARNQPLHGTAKQSAIARSATVTGIIGEGAAFCGTGFTIVLTDVNMTTVQITSNIISLLAIALGSLIVTGLLAGGIFFPRGRGYRTLLSTVICQLPPALCNIIIAFTTAFDGIRERSAFDGNSLFYRVFTKPLGPFGFTLSFNIITLLLMWQQERRAPRSSQAMPTTTGQPHQYPFT